jgi:hypothetical protein
MRCRVQIRKTMLLVCLSAATTATTMSLQAQSSAGVTPKPAATKSASTNAKSASTNTTNGGLHGNVTDPDGAEIPGAVVSLLKNGKVTQITNSKSDGSYTLSPIPAGTYSIQVEAKGFSATVQQNVVLAAAQTLNLNFKLNIQTETQQVVVSANDNTALDTSPDNNASEVSITGKDLDALSDDPDELQNELTALAGPAAGPGGGQIYVDGFTAGQMPPKSAIREIRINQNPYSAQYDQPGYGRIQIFTKPGSDKRHAYVSFYSDPSQLNTSNPFSPNQPSYNTYMFQGSTSGPISKAASYFVDGMNRDFHDNAIVNAQILNSSYQQTTYSQVVPYTHTHYELAPRLDLQVRSNNTLSIRYQYYHLAQNNNGVGNLNLASTGYTSTAIENAIQAIDTQTYGTKVVNETRFQFLGDTSDNTPSQTGASVNVEGGFNGGGYNGGTLTDRENHYEVQNYTSIALAKNFIRTGGRLRVQTSNNSSNSGYNGLYNFTSLADYASVSQAAAASISKTAPLGASDNFSITYGTPLATLNYFDLGLYAETDWKATKNMTWSYGLRFESQSGIHDHADWAPRTSISYGFDNKNGAPTYVVRAGGGIFYSRISTGSLLTAQRLNPYTGTQRSYSIPGSDVSFYPNIPTEATISASSTSTPSYYTLAPNLHAAYLVQSSIAIDHNLTKKLKVSATYLNSQGRRVSTELDLNAPTPASNYTARPLAALTGQSNNNYNLFQNSSEADYNQHQFILNFNLQNTKYASLGAYYVINSAQGDTVGTPSNSYNLKQDYGPTSFDIHQRLFFWGNISLPYELSLNPNLMIFTGSPYSITSGNDFNGDSVYNDRPGIASQARISQCSASSSSCFGQVVATPDGTFDVDPEPAYAENIVPIDSERGPLSATFNLSVGKTFGFGPLKDGVTPAGPDGGGGHNSHHGGPDMGPGHSDPHKYTVVISGRANNLFNIADYSTPSGTLSPYVNSTTGTVDYSSEFGVSQGLAGGPFTGDSALRRVYLSTSFNF